MKINLFLLIIILILFNAGCSKKGGNPVLYYLKNSELKYDNKMQRDNIIRACTDAIMYAPEDLKKKRYKDYEGNEDRWDLQTLLTKHFVPQKLNLTWGDNFYEDVKQDSVKAIFSYIIVSY
jgi:hypothetical protein